MHSPHSEQHLWHCGDGCLEVRNVSMEMQSITWEASDENCVGIFRALDHSGMKYPKLIVHCLPVQSAEHFAVGLHR